MERDLFLTQQLIDTGKKVVVLMNFMDEVEKNHVWIDFEMLSKFLGVQIIPMTAAEEEGFELLPEAILQARQGTQREELHSHLHEMLNRVGSQAEALLIAEGDHIIAGRHAVPSGNLREKIYIDRRTRVNYILDRILTDTSRKKRISEYLGRWTIRPITGIPVLLVFYVSFHRKICLANFGYLYRGNAWEGILGTVAAAIDRYGYSEWVMVLHIAGR
jgi:ferrous iron transport protein B